MIKNNQNFEVYTTLRKLNKINKYNIPKMPGQNSRLGYSHQNRETSSHKHMPGNDKITFNSKYLKCEINVIKVFLFTN